VLDVAVQWWSSDLVSMESKRNRPEVPTAFAEALCSSYRYVVPTRLEDLAAAPPKAKEEAITAAEVLSLAAVQGAAVEGLASLPLVLLATRNALVWLRRMPRGVIVAKFEPVAAPDQVQCVSNLTTSAAAVVTKSAIAVYSTVSLCVTASLPIHHDADVISVSPDGTWVVTAADKRPTLTIYRHEGGAVKLHAEVKATAGIPRWLMWGLSCLIAVDSLGVIEYLHVDSWKLHPVKGAVKKAGLWGSKADTDLFILLKEKTNVVQDACVAPDEASFALAVTSPGSRCRHVMVFDVATGRRTLFFACAPGQGKDGESSAARPNWASTDVIAGEYYDRREGTLNGTRGGHLSWRSSTLLLYVAADGIWEVNIGSRTHQRCFMSVDCQVVPMRWPLCIPGALAATQEVRDLHRTLLQQDDVGEVGTQISPEEMLICGIAAAEAARPTLACFWSSVLEEPAAPRDAKPFPAPGFQLGAAAVDVRSGGAQLVRADKATIETSHGTIVVALLPDEAPKAVHNFITLSKAGFYNGLTFHRIVKGFMIQGGCPRGDGTGGDSAFDGVPFEDEVSSGRRIDQFCLCMANRGPSTNESQFFITCAATPWLQGKHTVFGQVVEGFDAVKAIENVPTDKNNDRPLRPVIIRSVVPNHE
jgi:cyclophilin family peptidyl-prolyl cis-trans isomerase